MTRKTNHLKIILSVTVLTVAVSGCVNLKAPPDPTRYYLLNGASRVDTLAESAVSTGPVVRLAPVELDP